MRPTTMFVNCVFTTEITQLLRRLGVPVTVNFPRATRRPASNNVCDP